jgi:hypothetical protein
MKRISYKEIDDTNGDDGTSDDSVKGMQTLWGAWDDSMRSLKPGEEGDLATILASDTACTAYDKVVTEQAADKAKGKKVKPLPPAPPKCRLVMGPMSPEGVQMVYEVIAEPEFDILPNEPQQLTVQCSAVADNATFKCEGNNENIHFRPTFMLQSTVHTFTFTNDSAVTLPVKWSFDDIKRKGGTRQGIHICMHAIYIYTFIYIHMYRCVYVEVILNMYGYIYMHLYTYIYLYIYIYIYIYIYK